MRRVAGDALTSDAGAQLGSTSVTVTGTGGIFPADAGSLVVSEVNYNPLGTSDSTEFLELLKLRGGIVTAPTHSHLVDE